MEDNHNGDNQLWRSWDKDGEARKYQDQQDIEAMKNDYGYRGRRDGDGRFEMVKLNEQKAVNNETRASKGHNSRRETGDSDHSRKMTGYGGYFTRA